jgi:hypothetical protein
MVTADPSILVRTGAALALGEYSDERAIPVLIKSLGQRDVGFEAEGHRDGELRRTAVRSLGKIGTDDALAALYKCARDGPASSFCIEFWVKTKEPKHLAAFLKFHDANPPKEENFAGIIAYLLRNEKFAKLNADDQAKAEAEFRKSVSDPKQFGPDADLTDKGKYSVRTTFTFHGDEFVRVDFAFRNVNPAGYGHGYSILYRKIKKEWKPLGKVSGWVE